MKIFGKIVLLFLVLAMIPLLLVAYLSVTNVEKVGKSAIGNTVLLGQTVASDSEKALTNMGEEIMKIQAELTADRVSTYVLDHPTMTADQLAKDPAFLAIAQQKVGETGYISMSKWVEEKGSIFVSHPNPKLIGVPINALREKFPDLLAICDAVEKSHIGSGGYYKWQEADGSFRDKYVWITSRSAIRTADGYEMNVSATTYIDEFRKPIAAMQEKINNATNGTKLSITDTTSRMISLNILIVIVVFLIVIFVGLLTARNITNPIIKLKNAADKITQGDFNVTMPKVKSSDEIGELTASMEMLVTAIKNKK